MVSFENNVYPDEPSQNELSYQFFCFLDEYTFCDCNAVNIVFLPFEKGSTLKKIKEFAPVGGSAFLLGCTRFPNGLGV